MRVLLVSKFLHHVGGVETYLQWLAHALHDAGHTVGLVGMAPPFGTDLMDLPDVPTWRTPSRSFAAGATGRIHSAAASVWSPATAKVMRQAVNDFAPDVVHFHGTCYQLTPSVVEAVAHAGIRSVLTAHEYKLICANQTLFDDGTRQMCTACVGVSGPRKSAAILARSCMKGSRAVSTLGAVEGRIADRVWAHARPKVLAPSTFMRNLLVEDGWSPDQVEYLDLPWRGDDEQVGTPATGEQRNVVYLGRLAPNKGVDLLLRAWHSAAGDLGASRLRILGDGAETEALKEQVRRRDIPRVDFLGYADRATVQRELSQAFVTVHPSRWHENSPFSVRESLMAGVPAVVSRVGGMPEMVSSESGYVVPFDDAQAWTTALLRASAEGLAGSESLRRWVTDRAMTRADHLNRLLAAYREG